MSLINYFKENKDEIKNSLVRRGMGTSIIDELDKLSKSRTELLQKLEDKRRLLNEKTPKESPDEDTKSLLRQISDDAKVMSEDLLKIEEDLNKILNKMPNLTSPDSPDGGEDDSKEVKKWGKIDTISNPKDHEQLGKELDLIDFESGTVVSGAKFYYLKNEAVFLEFALISYVMEILRDEGFIPMITPQIVKNEILESIGFVPRGNEKQVYGLDEEGLSLIGTAEVTLGGYHKDQILKNLPLKYAGFSTCFRTEAGAYGKHSKGLYRVHQFDKVEMFIYCSPNESEKMHQYLLSIEEKIFQGLMIPYRVVDIAAGDLGASAYRKFDIEAYMPGRGDYGEVTSTSNTTDYQSIRLNIKAEKTKEYVHTLNGTAIAISRALIAILENYQHEDGSIDIPDVLKKYCGISKINRKKLM